MKKRERKRQDETFTYLLFMFMFISVYILFSCLVAVLLTFCDIFRHFSVDFRPTSDE